MIGYHKEKEKVNGGKPWRRSIRRAQQTDGMRRKDRRNRFCTSEDGAGRPSIMSSMSVFLLSFCMQVKDFINIKCPYDVANFSKKMKIMSHTVIHH
jgi:hypothetical protein